MISFSVLYPKSDDTSFDMDYFVATHMPLLANRLGDACLSWNVSAPTEKYHAMIWVVVESQEALNATLAEHGAEILGDVPNYTNAQPELIIGDLVK